MSENHSHVHPGKDSQGLVIADYVAPLPTPLHPCPISPTRFLGVEGVGFA